MNEAEQQRQRAREQYAYGADDNIEIDDNAQVLDAEGGVWVQAWVWVSTPLE